MKLKSKLAGAILALFGITAAESAISINIRNFSSSSAGVPIVTSAGVPVDQGQAFASAGVFTVGVNFDTMSAQEVLAFFTPLDSSPVPLHSVFDGLFTAQDFQNQVYGSGAFAGNTAYVLVGNNSTLASSTLIAVYNTNALFPVPDAIGNAAGTFTATTPGQWVYGTLRPVTIQPAISGSSYLTGVQLVPEPTVALLGTLGLLGMLRRRR